jgi:chloramphenicol-sensitive protein RarD
MKKGIFFGIGAYLLWGLFPIYWKWLQSVSAIQLLCHRIIWSFILLSIILFFMKQWRSLLSEIRNRCIILVYLVSAIFLATNWLTYVWAVNAGFVIETSLGYFINPLFSVLLGVLFLKESLRPLQWGIIGIATIGVSYVAVSYGQFPWIALTLAFTFGIYGLIKKTAPLSSLHGLSFETGILFLPALLYLIIMQTQGKGAFLHHGTWLDVLMMGAGVVTTIPLLLFASSAHRIPLSTLGILQYITPTMQFLLGVFIYREPFNLFHLIGFCIVWLALILFWVEGYAAGRRILLQAPITK